MTDTEGRVLSQALHDLVEHPVVAPDLADRVIQRHHRRVQMAALASAVVVVAGVASGVGLASHGRDRGTLVPAVTPSPSAHSDEVATLPPGAVVPSGCDTVRSSLPRATPNAAHEVPAPTDKPISELQAICVAEKGSLDGDLKHPAWAWLTTRAQIRNYGWDGCACNNPDRTVWVVAVAGPAQLEGGPGTPSRRVVGFSVVLDAATGQGTDGTVGALLLRGGRTVRLSGPAASPSPHVAPKDIYTMLAANGIACHPPTPTRPDAYRIDFTLVRCGTWTLAYWNPGGEQDALRQMNGADKVGPATLSGTGWQISGDANLLGQMQKIIGGVLSMPG